MSATATVAPSPSLRTVLAADAAICGAMGALLLAAAGPIAAVTRLPSSLLVYAGLALVPTALYFGWVASRPAPERVRGVILGNALWVAASVVLVLSPWISPNAFGVAFVLGQALVVTALAWLEQRGLTAMRFRRS